MNGIVTRNAEEAGDGSFDRTFYEVKRASGEAVDPLPEAISVVSCFRDAAAVERSPELAPVDERGDAPAAGDGGAVCPTDERYRAGVIETIADCGAASGDVRIDDLGFPGAAYCHCDRCDRLFAGSDHEHRDAWRAAVVADVLEAAAERVPGRLYLSVYPDPYPGHLFEHSGIDLDAAAQFVDEFVVPLYDTAYATTYWLSVLAEGFDSALSTPFAVELYAAGVDVDALIDAAAAVEDVADGVYFGYDASTAAAAMRRKRADERPGVTHRPPDG